MNGEDGKRQFLYLDGLRGLAAAIIALGHFSDWSPLKLDNVMALWVGFFFILSGFVLTQAYQNRVASGTLSFRDYVVLRLSRLYPLHLITGLVAASVLVGVFALRALKMIMLGLWGNPGIASPEFICGPTEVVEALTLSHFLLGGGVCFNTPSWSIGVEFWCSLFAFFLFLPGYRGLKAFAIAVVLCGFILTQMKGGFLGSPQWIGGVIEKNYATGLGCFTLGWIIACAVEPHTNTGMRKAGWIALAIAVFLTTAGAEILKGVGFFAEIVFFILCVFLLVCFATTQIPANGFFEKVLRRSGAYSYGIYLWHMPVILIFDQILAQLGLRFGVHLKETAFLLAAYVLLVGLAAHLSFHWLEQPAKHWLRRRYLVGRV